MPLDAPRRPGLLRSAFQLVVGWGFTCSFAFGAGLLSLFTLGLCRGWLSPLLLRFYGRVALRIQRVTLRIEGGEHLRARATRVATFNHTSTLDAMIIPVLNPSGGVSVMKREVLFVPIVGVAAWLMGFLMIDRGRSERAKATLDRAAARMRRERLTVFIAPEGTRSEDGVLAPFKRGAFHLALVSGAPIVPIVIVGAHALKPKGRAVCSPGVVHVRVLPPIETAGLTSETMGSFADELHARYERELAAMALDQPSVG